MRRLSLFGQLFPAFTYLSMLSFVAIIAFACYQFKKFYFHEAKMALKSWVHLATLDEGHLGEMSPESLSAWVTQAAKTSGLRVSIINSAGRLVADSHQPAGRDGLLLDRPEINRSLQDGSAYSLRRGVASKDDFMYFAKRLNSLSGTVRVLRASRPVAQITGPLYNVYTQIAVGGIIVMVIISIYSWWFAKKTIRPLEEMKEQAARIARGDFKGRIHVAPGVAAEIGELGQSMNDIAVKLDKRYRDLLTQKNQQDAVFSSMGEGVVAVSPDENILYLNEAAQKILDIPQELTAGGSIQEAIRVPDIQSFIFQSLRNFEATEKDIELPGGIGNRMGETVILQMRSSPLRDARDKRIGTVLVFSDITKLRRLESHRRDFVANVSHELRTPLTSIQGFAETLLSSDVGEDDKQKFLEIIHRHSTRLSAIIKDLLELSRIERDAEEGAIELKPGKIRPALLSAIELCQVKADRRNISIALDAKADPLLLVNSALLEQAVVNLIDNAMKYSNDGQKVEVELENLGEEVRISVKDYGHGIPKEHLPRLFERFYRVDKARSRQLGGTGLGLSIVKHVTHAHRGRIAVESEVGKGARFSIFLPVDPKIPKSYQNSNNT